MSLLCECRYVVYATEIASFGAGITVVSLTVNSATTATTVVNIDAGTATGNRNVTLTTGLEVVTLTNGFTVAAGTPVLQTVNPGSGQQGQQNLDLNITGQYSHLTESTYAGYF